MTLVKHVIRLQREKEMLTSFSESKKERKRKKKAKQKYSTSKRQTFKKFFKYYQQCLVKYAK